MRNGTIPLSVPGAQAYRPANMIERFSLYYNLAKLAENKSGGKGYEDGTTCVFTREEIEKALLSQHIHPNDLPLAIRTCINAQLLDEKADGFHVTNNGLSNYYCMLRRV
ncbi:MAG: hypothetical protein PHC53_04075 [Patescibacteria group bacterium]|nr:hypothetical protein [Patescibacteria group bacterium]